MSIFEAIIFGIVQGFTEFLPISSTGHLIVTSKFLDIEQTNMTKAYEVIIQLASILALFLTYKSKFSINQITLWNRVFIAFLPIGIIGFIFAKHIKTLFSIEIVALMFIIGGIIFLIVEKYYQEDNHKTKNIEDISYRQAFFIGIFQIAALIPGTSRAGSTIIGGMLLKINRKCSTEFSFLLALPVLCAASFYDLIKHYQEFNSSNLLLLIVGFFTSFIFAYIAIKIFLKFLENFTFVFFGIYRIVIGILLLILF
jgi:undecaprenyl-diphosphatase